MSRIDSRQAREESELILLRREVRGNRRLLSAIALMLLAVVTYFAKDIMMPVVLGFLFALTLTPVVRKLSKIGLPASVAAALVVISIAAALLFGIYSLSSPFGKMINDLPKISYALKSKLRPYQETIKEISDASEKVQKLTPTAPADDVRQVVVEQPGLINAAASKLVSGIKLIGGSVITEPIYPWIKYSIL